LATAKLRAEPEVEVEADSEHFDTFGTLQLYSHEVVTVAGEMFRLYSYITAYII
jgi:hypothetical protein